MRPLDELFELCLKHLPEAHIFVCEAVLNDARFEPLAEATLAHAKTVVACTRPGFERNCQITLLVLTGASEMLLRR